MVDLSEADSNKWVRLGDHVAKCDSSVEPIVAPRTSRDDNDLWRPIKQKQRRFSAEEELAVMADYADGGTVYSLAAKYGCHRTTISRILKAHEVELANAPIEPEMVDEIVRLYESGLSMDATARQTGVSAKTVLNHLRTRGVRTRDSRGRERRA